MYFESRAQAGARLATELIDLYRYKNTAILALSSGGVMIGYQIAIYLHAALKRLIMETIRIEDESETYGTMLPGGVFAPNPDLGETTMQYYYGEYAGDLDQKLREATSRINKVIGPDDISPENLRGYNVIVVDDGVHDGMALDAARVWLKPARIERMILATPLISVPALDKAHILFDELHILNVVANFMPTSHYYEQNDIPDAPMIKAMIDDSILHWK